MGILIAVLLLRLGRSDVMSLTNEWVNAMGEVGGQGEFDLGIKKPEVLDIEQERARVADGITASLSEHAASEGGPEEAGSEELSQSGLEQMRARLDAILARIAEFDQEINDLASDSRKDQTSPATIDHAASADYREATEASQELERQRMFKERAELQDRAAELQREISSRGLALIRQTGALPETDRERQLREAAQRGEEARGREAERQDSESERPDDTLF